MKKFNLSENRTRLIPPEFTSLTFTAWFDGHKGFADGETMLAFRFPTKELENVLPLLKSVGYELEITLKPYVREGAREVLG